MTTFGVTTWPLTVGEIVRQTLVKIGALNMGEAPEAQEMADGTTALAGMLKSWSLEANLFREESGTFVIAGGTGGATLDSRVEGTRKIEKPAIWIQGEPRVSQAFTSGSINLSVSFPRKVLGVVLSKGEL